MQTDQDPATPVVSQPATASTPKTPPPEAPLAIRIRWLILFSFWAVVVFLGLPYWLWTTSIHRSELPVDVMNDWAEGNTFNIHYPLFIRIDGGALDAVLQSQLSSRIDMLLKAQLSSDIFKFDVSHETSVQANDSSSPDPALTVAVQQDVQVQAPTASLRSWASIMDVKIPRVQTQDIEPLASFLSQEILQTFKYERDSIAFLLSNTRHVDSQRHPVSPQDRAVLEARMTRTFKYASRYHLSFSLFSASSSPSAWDIQSALDRNIRPLLDSLSDISQFSVVTQVQLHASFSPSIAGPHFDENSQQWMLEKDDLSGFINAAEWPLSPSIGSGPTINLVLYVPAKSQSPLSIAQTGGHSWLIPQWGGVQIFNPGDEHPDELSSDQLQPVMLTFADQLTSLLGLPPSPSSLALRISSLTRERAISVIISASSTLGALARLTLKLTSIAIPDTVAKSVDEAIKRLNQACIDLHAGRFDQALENARIAEAEAESAFFDPSMVGQVYFPDEHKVAVYVPLLGPMAVPLVTALLKEVSSLRKSKLKVS